MNPRIMDALPTELAGAVFDQLTLKHMVAASGEMPVPGQPRRSPNASTLRTGWP